MSIFAAGFADPVLDAQAVFRATMTALSRPGIPLPIGATVAAPAPLTPALAALTLMLADPDTWVWLEPRIAGSSDVRDWLAFQTGAPVVDDPAHAGFALVLDLAAALPLERFTFGTDEYPDRSTTILAAVPTLTGGPRMILSGPGIDGATPFEPLGLPDTFVAESTENNAQFPRGVDLLLVADNAIVGLPRTTRIELEG